MAMSSEHVGREDRARSPGRSGRPANRRAAVPVSATDGTSPRSRHWRSAAAARRAPWRRAPVRPSPGPSPSRRTSCGVMRASMNTFASAAALAAASQPSTSSDGSASAMPSACIRAQRRRERFATLERAQDVIGRAVDDAAEAEDGGGRQRLPHEVEDRHAVHDRAFEEERQARGSRQRLELRVGERRRALVRGHDVAAGRERRCHVVDRRPAVLDVEGRRLDDHPQRRVRVANSAMTSNASSTVVGAIASSGRPPSTSRARPDAASTPPSR